MSNEVVVGYCPMGCGRTLFLASGGYVTCTGLDCPRPSAVADLLNDRETEHIVHFTETGFTVRHPLRERLDDDLMNCDIPDRCSEIPVRPLLVLDTYRATMDPDGDILWTKM